jgi:MATE family multidrug resistance protein
MQQSITYKSIWNISYPIILGGVAQTVVNVTDTAFLGRVNEVALGASAIAGLFYVTVFMLGLGFSIGTQIIIARFDGENNHREIGRVLDHSIYFMLPLCTCFVSISKICFSLAPNLFCEVSRCFTK